ncbi:fungal-specific transcription factor domain-containing protein [Fusarium tricinctum]|uniref:Fungal-specific transcription factor domain-containing protein n=1 Tax=Fusarium tricinctum TaxID=61284 RepID=A0A8K0WCQ7_9HYPO|nr:fungal-specific transcription factor domain-containing protein [Fusarium tricinctum]
MDENEITVQQSPSATAPPTPPTHTPRRALKRNSAACERCRRRKQKCDGKLPSCGPCLLVQARCVPSDRLLIRADPNCQCQALKERVRDLEGQLEALRAERSSNGLSGAPDPPYQQPLVSRVATQLVDDNDATYHGRILRPSFPESNSGSILRSTLRGSPWQLWAGDLDSQTSPDVVADFPDHLLTTDSEALVEVYFTNRWPQLPILHKPTFFQDDFLPTTKGDPGNTLSPFRVNMVLAIASAEANIKGPQQHQQAHKHFFQKAVKDLGLVLAAEDLDCIQCLLLLCLYGTNEPQSVNIWYTLGLALRIALGIDLHREESSSTSQDLLSQEMARRLFWCIYTLDRSMSIAMGRPLGINDSDITVPLPRQLTDEQLCCAGDVPSIVQNPKDMSTFLHVIRIRQINAAIYTSLHAASASENSDSERLDLLREGHYADLNAWLVTAPRYGPAGGVPMLQTTEWFQIAYHYAVLSLYRPSRVFPISNISSLRLCTDSAISLISCYHTLYAKNRISYTFVALNSLFMAAVTMLYALRSSPVIRSELSKGIAKANIDMCQRLLRGVSDGRSVGERCAAVVGRLGEATMEVFDREQSLNDDIDSEFMSWFGLKLQNSGSGRDVSGAEAGQQITPSIDIPWNDLFVQGFDVGNHNYLEYII